STTHRHWSIQHRIDFPVLNLSQRRAFIAEVISAVLVYPPKGKGRQQRDLSRLEVHYLDGEVFRLSNQRSWGIYDLETGKQLTEQFLWEQ
ncbi:MAG: hypothetical protein M3440_00995, partial [Chloroflexota bacterium]|nr:hypothetical protein [Chloroflexota bacterium]